MFANSKKVEIRGGQITHVEGNMNIRMTAGDAGRLKGLDLLRERSSLGSLLDSSERFNPPSCAPQTRENIISEICSWIDAPNPSSSPIPSSLLWLYGPAGAGKSALAQTLAELYRVKSRLSASNFFSRAAGSEERSDGDRLVPTLVLQLIKSFSEIKGAVETKILNDPTIFHLKRDTQLQMLFVDPINDSWLLYLRRFSWKSSTSHLIVIDGLDECRDTEVQRDILFTIMGAIAQLRFPFRVLLTSRPEGHLLRAFTEIDAIYPRMVKRIDLSQDFDASKGMRLLFERSFEQIRQNHPLKRHLPLGWPATRHIDTLVCNASSQFVYASTVNIYVSSPRHRPDDRLNIILRLSQVPNDDKPFAQLDALYTEIFRSVPPSDMSTVKLVLGVLYLAGQVEFSHFKAFTHTPDMETALGLPPGQLTLLLEPLFSLIAVPESPYDPVKVLHASLFDFLTDSIRSRDLYLDPSCLLDEFYYTFLFHVIGPHRTVPPEEEDNRSRLGLVLGTLYLASLPHAFHLKGETATASLARILSLEEGSILSILYPLRDMIAPLIIQDGPSSSGTYRTLNDDPLEFYHLSVVEFLIDPDRAKDLLINIESVHYWLAEYYGKFVEISVPSQIIDHHDACDGFLYHISECTSAPLSSKCTSILEHFPVFYNLLDDLFDPESLVDPKYVHYRILILLGPRAVFSFLSALLYKVDNGTLLYLRHLSKIRTLLELKLSKLGIKPMHFQKAIQKYCGSSAPEFHETLSNSEHLVYGMYPIQSLFVDLMANYLQISQLPPPKIYKRMLGLLPQKGGGKTISGLRKCMNDLQALWT